MNGERVERRLAAILAADVAGYSRLMSADEEGTLSALKALRQSLVDPKLAEHRGRIVKTTGDGLLAEFSSAVDAVRCAIDMQRALAEHNAGVPEPRRIEFRIGINVGDIIADAGDIYGDGVNIAARVEALAAPGSICLSDNAYRQIKGKLALDVTDMGEQALKNIPQPVRLYGVRLDAAPAPALALPDRPSIAVLPFQNMSGDPEQEYFADGIVEEIITGLSRLKWLFVIARNSSFTYKGRAVDVRQVGRELGVRYVLEGSVRKGGQRVRITVQLVEAATGSHLWADRYDGNLDDVFDLQDRITLDVVHAIEPSVQKAEVERARHKRPENLDAYDHFLRALPHAWANSLDDAPKALEHLEAALRIDPDYATAHAYAAHCLLVLFARQSRDPAERAAAVHHARTALAGSTDDSTSLAFAGFVLAILDRDYAAAQAALNRALAINPDSALALGYFALLHAFMGRYDAAIELANKASRASPLDPLRYRADMGRGLAYLHTGRYAESITALQRAVEAAPRFVVARALLAAAYSCSGRMEDARAAVQRLLELEPYRMSSLDAVTLGPPDKMEALKAALRKAGLPE
jgi:TolB-like protein/Tfp pilus assembly protein PilF